MKSTTRVLHEARRLLEQNHVPSGTQERFPELLTLLMAIINDTLLQDVTLTKRLVDVLADNGNLIMLIQRQAAQLGPQAYFPKSDL